MAIIMIMRIIGMMLSVLAGILWLMRYMNYLKDCHKEGIKEPNGLFAVPHNSVTLWLLLIGQLILLISLHIR